MVENVVHGFDTLEVFRVHDMLMAGPVMDFGTQVGAERGEDGIQDGKTGYVELTAGFLKSLANLIVDQRVKDKAGIGLDAYDNLVKLALVADHGPDVFICLHVLELGQSGAGH